MMTRHLVAVRWRNGELEKGRNGDAVMRSFAAGRRLIHRRVYPGKEMFMMREETPETDITDVKTS